MKILDKWKPILLLKHDGEKNNVSAKLIKKEWKQSSRGIQSRIRRGFELAVKYNLSIVMPKKSDMNIDIINYITERWQGDKALLTDEDWEHLLSSDF